MKAKAPTRRVEKSESALEADRLISELISDDPRLEAANRKAIAARRADHVIARDTVQVYRQKLKE